MGFCFREAVRVVQMPSTYLDVCTVYMCICGFKCVRHLNLFKVLTKRTWCLAGPNVDPAMIVNNPVHGRSIVPPTYWFLVGTKGIFMWGLQKDHIPLFPTGSLPRNRQAQLRGLKVVQNFRDQLY